MSQNDSRNSGSVDAQLAELQRNYILKLDQKIKDILSVWQSVQNSPQPTDDIYNLHRTVHSVAGTSAILNFMEVSRICSSIELLLLPILKAETYEENTLSQIGIHMNELNTLRENHTYSATPINLEG
ncbi:Hpt domain-containing protein [Zhongshania aquimaris]|uniref:Hpt domain-containing protein n=1 Tax=Zhongshania aquimaris TaxID=2857107 RepID=A0ABS6VWY1_9GAMM|nr:Hpt domain-containing protein [Zhongshania aquimaris]MBW2942781.1 Hpt domain-containing protein [Zhongshania aquimaris]